MVPPLITVDMRLSRRSWRYNIRLGSKRRRGAKESGGRGPVHGGAGSKGHTRRQNQKLPGSLYFAAASLGPQRGGLPVQPSATPALRSEAKSAAICSASTRD